MSIISSFKNRRTQHATRESIETLTRMEGFFKGGKQWTQGEYHAADGSKCLVGASDSVRDSSLDQSKYWLLEAIKEKTGGQITTIEGFNDSRENFQEIVAVIDRARELAAAARLPAPQILPPARLALPSAPVESPPALSAAPKVEAQPVPKHESPDSAPAQSGHQNNNENWWDE